MKTNRNISKNAEFFKIVFRYYKKEWKIVLLMGFAILTFSIARILIPILTQQMLFAIDDGLNRLTSEKAQSMYWGLSTTNNIIIAVIIVILEAFASYFYNKHSFILGRKIEIDLRNKILERLIRQDISYYSDKKIGEILTSVIGDTQNVGDSAAMVPSNFGIAFTQFIFAFVLTFVLDWKVALAGSILYFTILGIYFLFYKSTVKKYEVVRETFEEVNGNVTDRVGAIRLVKASGTEDYETEYLQNQQKTFYKAHKPAILKLAFLTTTVYAGVNILQLAIPIIAGLIYGYSSSSQTAATDFFAYILPAYITAQAILVMMFINLMNSSFMLAVAGVASIHVSELLNSNSILDPHYYDGIIVNDIKGDIVFKDVEFRYPEKPAKLILPKFNFVFEEGKSYAFVGETGSGKSTIARLMLRFYDPSAGEIIINKNQNLVDLNLASYLKNIGYVEQEPQILFGDVYENVRYGRFEASDEEVIEACKKAEIHNLIISWPQGYNTILGERGFMLSGGQKQRLVIARMILKDPSILILDEATSALDNIVEKEIQAKLNELMKGRTSITIAHRLSTIKSVDHIIVLGGNGIGVVQQGSFKDLVRQPGHFKNLYEAGMLEELAN